MREGKQQWGMRQPIILVLTFLLNFGSWFLAFVIKSQRGMMPPDLPSAEELRERKVALKNNLSLSVCIFVYLFICLFYCLLLSFIFVYCLFGYWV